MRYQVNGNIIKAYGDIWPDSGEEFVSVLNQVEQKHKNIVIHLHTGGGSVFDGNLMYNAIDQSPSNIQICVDGLAASMGAILLTSVDTVHIVSNGYIMIHPPSSGGHSTADEKEKEAKILRSMEADFIDKISVKTGKSKEELQHYMKGDHWLDAQEALALGIVDQIIPAQQKIKLPQESENIKAMMAAYTPTLLMSLNNQKIKPKNKIMKKEIIEGLDLKGLTEESSTTAVVEAATQKMSDLEATNQDLEAQIQKEKSNQIASLVAEKIKTGVIKEAQKDTYTKIGETSGIEVLTEALNGIAVNQSPNVLGQLQGGGQGDSRASWTFEKWQDEDPQGLEKMSETHPENFEKLFNQSHTK